MTGHDGQMVLGVFFNTTGHHVASWRHPGADADAGVNFKHYVRLAQTAEKAKFHFLFFADWLAVRDASARALLSASACHVPPLACSAARMRSQVAATSGTPRARCPNAVPSS